MELQNELDQCLTAENFIGLMFLSLWFAIKSTSDYNIVKLQF